MPIQHVKNITIADGTNTDIVIPSDWNSVHAYTLQDAVSLSGNTAGVMANISSGTLYLAGCNTVCLDRQTLENGFVPTCTMAYLLSNNLLGVHEVTDRGQKNEITYSPKTKEVGFRSLAGEVYEADPNPALLAALMTIAQNVRDNMPDHTSRLYSIKNRRVVPKMGKSVGKMVGGSTKTHLMRAKVKKTLDVFDAKIMERSVQESLGDSFLVETQDLGSEIMLVVRQGEHDRSEAYDPTKRRGTGGSGRGNRPVGRLVRD